MAERNEKKKEKKMCRTWMGYYPIELKAGHRARARGAPALGAGALGARGKRAHGC